MSLRNQSWRECNRFPTESTCNKYRPLREYCTQLVRKAKLKYQEGLSRKFISNSSLPYKHANMQRKVKNEIPAFSCFWNVVSWWKTNVPDSSTNRTTRDCVCLVKYHSKPTTDRLHVSCRKSEIKAPGSTEVFGYRCRHYIRNCLLR